MKISLCKNVIAVFVNIYPQKTTMRYLTPLVGSFALIGVPIRMSWNTYIAKVLDNNS